MKVRAFHRWDLDEAEAVRVQELFAQQVSAADEFTEIRTVCGVDVSYSDDGYSWAACVVLTYPGLVEVEAVCRRSAVHFGYIPGLFSFREIPPLVPALEALECVPDLFLCDGHGYAHPRRFGLACHLGLLLNTPAIGCAKSNLVGRFEIPGEQRGSFEYLYHKEEIIGAVLRTQPNKRPVFVSVGHKITLSTAVEIVMGCTVHGRIAEPLQRSHERARQGAEI